MQTEIYLDQGLAQLGCSHLVSQQIENTPRPSQLSGAAAEGSRKRNPNHIDVCGGGAWGHGAVVGLAVLGGTVGLDDL